MPVVKTIAIKTMDVKPKRTRFYATNRIILTVFQTTSSRSPTPHSKSRNRNPRPVLKNCFHHCLKAPNFQTTNLTRTD